MNGSVKSSFEDFQVPEWEEETRFSSARNDWLSDRDSSLTQGLLV